MGDPCQNAACLEAVRYLESISNSSSSPCQDFYEHVCGRWNHTGGVYEVTLRAAAGDAVEDLQSIRVPSYGQNTIQKASAAYRSCLSEVLAKKDMGAAIQYTVNYFHVTWDMLLRMSPNMTAVLEFMLSMSLRHQMDIGVHVRTYDDSVTMAPAEPFVTMWASDDLDVKTIMVQVVKEGLEGAKISHDDIEATMEIDATVYAADKGSKDVLTTLEEAATAHSFGVPVSAWMEVLNRHRRSSSVIVKSTRTVERSISALTTLSKELQAANVVARALFLYMHTVVYTVQVEVFKWKTPHEKTSKASSFCQTLFTPTVLQKVLEAHTADRLNLGLYGRTVSDMTLIIDANVDHRLESSWMTKKDLENALSVLQTQHKLFSWKPLAGNMQEFEQEYAGLPDMTDNFYQNYYTVRSFNQSVKEWLACKELNHGFFSYNSLENGVCGSTLTFATPIFYPGADAYINYATLGYLYGIERKFPFSLKHILRRTSSVGDAYERNALCLDKQRTALSRSWVVAKQTEPYDLEEVLFRVLALRAAYDAAPAGKPLLNHEQQKLFFRRACSMHCHEKPDHPNKERGLTPREMCNHVVRHMRDFYTVFYCLPSTRVASVEACQLF